MTADAISPLAPATYDQAEALARRTVSNRIVEAFAPVTFGGNGYPVHVDNVGELWKFADVMQERRFEHDFQHLLGGLTEHEYALFLKVNEAVLASSQAHFDRPMLAQGALLRALNTFRQLRHLVGDERPPVLEVGCGSGYLTALLALDGFPVIAHDVTQAFYLYQHMLWSALAPGGVRQVADGGERLVELTPAALGEVIHIPWWHFYDPDFDATGLAAGIVTCNHALCEMHPRSVYYLLQLSRRLIANHGAPGAFAFEGSGSDANVPMWYVNSRFYRYGFGLCHHDAGITIYADAATTPHVAGYPNFDFHNLPDATSIQRFAETTIGSLWQLCHFAPPQNPWSARLQAGRQALRPSVELPTVRHALRELYGRAPGATPDERFFEIVDVA